MAEERELKFAVDSLDVVREGELCIRINEAANQPSAGDPVDMAAGARGPLHASTSTNDASCSTAARASSRSGGGK